MPGVRAIAVLFAVCAIYLAAAGLLMLLRPGVISMASGAPLLFGLELSGPYMFLLMALLGLGIAGGLLRRCNLARRAAVLVAVAGIVMLIPPVSAATILVQPGGLALGGLGIIVRVIVALYLLRVDTVEFFRTPKCKAPPFTTLVVYILTVYIFFMRQSRNLLPSAPGSARITAIICGTTSPIPPPPSPRQAAWSTKSGARRQRRGSGAAPA